MMADLTAAAAAAVTREYDDDDVLGEESTETLAALFELKKFTHVYASRSGCVAKKKHE